MDRRSFISMLGAIPLLGFPSFKYGAYIFKLTSVTYTHMYSK